MSWPLVALKDCCRVVSGGTPKTEVSEYWNGPHYWVTPKDLSSLGNIYIDKTPETITDLGLKNSSAEILPIGTVLLSSRAPIGHLAITRSAMCTNQGFKSLIPSKKVDSLYLYFCMKHLTPELQALGNGATFKEVSKRVVDDFKIPLPPLETQKHIARVLEQADALRKHAQQMETELNQLAQSLFLEMFGDPVDNPKKWPSGTIDDVAIEEKGAVRCGPFGTQLKVHEIVDEGIPLLGIENVFDDNLHRNFEKFLTDEKAEELKAFSVRPDDVLITRMGTIGRSCVVPRWCEEARISYHLFRVRVDKEKCLPEFLVATISRSGTFQQQLDRLARGAIMAGLNTSVLKQVNFLIPPKHLQQEYVDRLNELEKFRESNNQRLRELEGLFQSLMQRAFKGELTAKAA